MYIFNMSVTYLQNVEQIQWVDLTKYALSTIIYRCSCGNMAKLKTL